MGFEIHPDESGRVHFQENGQELGAISFQGKQGIEGWKKSALTGPINKIWSWFAHALGFVVDVSDGKETYVVRVKSAAWFLNRMGEIKNQDVKKYSAPQVEMALQTFIERKKSAPPIHIPSHPIRPAPVVVPIPKGKIEQEKRIKEGRPHQLLAHFLSGKEMPKEFASNEMRALFDIAKGYVNAAALFFGTGDKLCNAFQPLLERAIAAKKAGKASQEEIQTELHKNIQKFCVGGLVGEALILQKEKISKILEDDDQKRGLEPLFNMLVEEREQEIQKRLQGASKDDFLKCLKDEMVTLKRQVQRCHNFYHTPQLPSNLYLDKGVCFGATVGYAAARVRHEDPVLRPDKAARFLQAAVAIEHKLGANRFEVSEQDREKLGIMLTDHPVPKNCTPDQFLKEVNSYDDIHCIVRVFSKDSGGHAIYISTAHPYEIQDVNYPKNADFRTEDFAEFKLFLAFWFAMHPQYIKVGRVERVAPRMA